MHLSVVPSRATHQAALRVIRKKNGGVFIGKYAKSGAKVWSSQMAELIRPYKPQEAISTPVKVDIAWVFPYPKNAPKGYANLVYREKRPDLDNMEKGLLDLLVEQGFIMDDSLIVAKHTAKFDGREPMVIIRITRLDIESAPHYLRLFC